MTAVNLTVTKSNRGIGIDDLDAIGVALAGAGPIAIEYPNDGNVIVLIRNTGTAALVCTLEGVEDENGRSADTVTTLPIGSVTTQFGLIPFHKPNMFNSQGRSAQLTFSSVATIAGSYILLYQGKD